MKNYYTTLAELNIAKSRLVTLEERKDLFMTMATKTTASIKENVSNNNKNNDKALNYVIQCEKIEQEMKELKQEIKILQIAVDKMDNYLSSIKHNTDLEKQVFILYYKENKKPEEIANRLPCGISTVYRKLKKINKILDNDKK